MGFGGGGGGAASVPPPPPPPPNPPSVASASISQAGQAQRAAMVAAAGQGFDNTITNKGGSLGIPASSTPTGQKRLLGE